MAVFWGIEQERALDREKPQKPLAVAVKVDLNLPSAPWGSEGLGSGIRALQARGERCDVDLEVCGEVFPAHQIMLASMSKAFRTFMKHLRLNGNSLEVAEDPMAGILSISQPPAAAAPAPTAESTGAPPPAAEATSAAVEPSTATSTPPASVENASAVAADGKAAVAVPQRLKLQISGISRPEAVQILLSYIYQVGTGVPWEFKPSCVQVNKDVLQLARHFELHHLHEYAARWLIDGLSTINVVERLVVCEEFQLGKMREKMMEQLAAFPDALGIVSSNPDIMKHPKIMQDLLKSVAFSTKRVEEKKVEETPPEKPEKKVEKVEKVEKAEKAEKADKADKAEKVEKAERAEKAEKAEKPERAEKPEKAERPERAEKAPEKQERPSAEKPPPAKKARKAGGA